MSNLSEPEDVKEQPHDVHKMVLARINKELQDGDKDSPVRKPESHTPHSSSPWVDPKTLNNSPQFSRTNPLISHHRHRKNFQSPITSRAISLPQNPPYRRENTGGTVQSILRDPPRTKCSKKKYNGFYADYCRSLCICDPCCPWHQPYSLLNSIFDTKNCCPEIETCPSRCPKKEEDKKESGTINCVKHVGRYEIAISENKPLYKKDDNKTGFNHGNSSLEDEIEVIEEDCGKVICRKCLLETHKVEKSKAASTLRRPKTRPFTSRHLQTSLFCIGYR